MGAIKHFEDIVAWQSGIELVNEVYRITTTGNFGKDFGLKDQIRRAAVSVVSNIAEGFEREGDKEFMRFLSYAKGSCGEVRTQIYIARDLEYLNGDVFNRLQEMLIRTSELISGLMRYLKNSELEREK